MLTVGLTGNIASGKSTVGRVWRSLGARVVDSDQLAREAVRPGSQALRAIVAAWGEGVLSAGGELDRAALRAIVFRDETARRRLEAIVHPEVERLRAEAFTAAESEGAAVAVADIPLLFETGMEARFDLVVLVDAPPEAREERIVRDRDLDRDEARRMIDAQMPAIEKRERADIVIENDTSIDALETRARSVWKEILTTASQHSE